MWLALKRAVLWKTTMDLYPVSTPGHQKNILSQIRRRFRRIRRKAHVEAQQRGRLCCRRSRSTCCAHLRWQQASVADCSEMPCCCFFWPSCSASELRRDGGSAEQSGRRPSENALQLPSERNACRVIAFWNVSSSIGMKLLQDEYDLFCSRTWAYILTFREYTSLSCQALTPRLGMFELTLNQHVSLKQHWHEIINHGNGLIKLAGTCQTFHAYRNNLILRHSILH